MTDYLDHKTDLNDPDLVSVYNELPLWSAPFGQLLLANVPLQRNLTVLDVGCATGFPLFELAQRLGSTCHAHGIDPWEPAMERAAHKQRVYDLADVSLHTGDAAEMPYSDATFDLVVSCLGINNFTDPLAILRECWRVARPGATLALTTNLTGHMQEFYDVFLTTLEELGRDDYLSSLREHIEHRGSVASITALLEEAHFQVVRVIEDRFTMRFLDGSAFLRHYFIKVGFLDDWKTVVAEVDHSEVFARVEENLNRVSAARGELALTVPMVYVEATRSAT